MRAPAPAAEHMPKANHPKNSLPSFPDTIIIFLTVLDPVLEIQQAKFEISEKFY